MGAVCRHLPAPDPPNVKSLGFLDEADKIRQLRTCTVALNPLFSGAGTNLKMLDYMAAGAPIVASPVGARGLDLEHGIDTYIIDTGAFTPTIRSVLADRAASRIVGATAQRKAFTRYIWQHIAEGARGSGRIPDFRCQLAVHDRRLSDDATRIRG